MDEIYTPFRFRSLNEATELIVNEVGDYSFVTPGLAERLYGRQLSPDEAAKLRDMFILLDGDDDWRLTALSVRARKRVSRRADKLSYMLIIPTLRCDLACTYCQVSRASEQARGYDMKTEKLNLLERFWDEHAGDEIKIEFQGGEPTLRPDLLEEIIGRAERRFKSVEFAICTNLMNITPEIEKILARPNLHISTSVDGPKVMMAHNRTGTSERAEHFFKNLSYIMQAYGSDKVSALPTIPVEMFNQINEIIDLYVDLGFSSIFLRPVNYLGFARKNHASSVDDAERWTTAYLKALEYIMEINKTRYFEEFYASMMFQKIVGGGTANYVDFRSPNSYFEDYCVVDYDGSLYPTDEARMLSRTRQVDLKIGELGGDLDRDMLATLNLNSMNEVHPDCVHCTYGPFCGIDLVDDLSRYGRIDLPKHETAFCKRHIRLFDVLFTKIAERDRSWLDPLMAWAFRKRGPEAPYEMLYD